MEKIQNNVKEHFDKWVETQPKRRGDDPHFTTLGALVGQSKAMIRRWVKKKANPSYTQLAQLAKVFGCDPCELIGWDERPFKIYTAKDHEECKGQGCDGCDDTGKVVDLSSQHVVVRAKESEA